MLTLFPATGDIILVSLREYQDEKGDVILKYSADEARSLYVMVPCACAPITTNIY